MVPRPVLCVTLFCFAVFVTSTTATSQTAENCPTSINSKVPEIKRCMRLGDRFVKKYLMYLKKEAEDRKVQDFNVCRKFGDFYNCIQPLLEGCPHLQPQFHEIWQDVYGNFSCLCSKSPDSACQERTVDRGCFEHEYWSELSEHCDLYYAYSEKYSAQQKCYYLQKRTQCREKRVTQICGLSTGLFTHTITKLFYTRHKHRYPDCDIGPPTGVVPISTCPKNFIEKMDECEDRHLRDMLEFYKENAMVAKEGPARIKMTCRNFLRYRQCIKPLQDKCPEEKKHFFSFYNKLRTYDMKMQLICINYTLDYRANLPCYKRVVENNILGKCNPLWGDVQPLFESHDAHDFYCQSGNALSRELSRLRSCYERKVSEYKAGNCTFIGSAILDTLTKNALNDPMYLKYNYAPFCIPKNVTFPTTSTITTTEKSTSMSSTDSSKTRSNSRTNSDISQDTYSTSDPNILKGITYHMDSNDKKEIKTNKGPNEVNKPRSPRNSAQNHNGVSRTCKNVSYLLVLCFLALRIT